MRPVIIYEVMIEEGSREVCFRCAVNRVNEQDCMVYTSIEEYEDLQYPVCQDCNKEF